MKVEYNILRLRYLLDLYGISVDELIDMISEGLKMPILKEEILSKRIKLNYLKRIDKVFDKGLYFYLDPKAIETNKEASIFFRKEKFNTKLNFGAKKIVNQFEDFKISLTAIAKLAELNIERNIPIYTVNDSVKSAAQEMRKLLYPTFNSKLKDFLIALIAEFAEKNILVFEFVETWNKKEKANVNGFFLNPNVIVLKRLQKSFRREIFTLIHELGHYLLNAEEIEKIDYNTLARSNLTSVEKWCNEFAFFFLVGEYVSEIEGIKSADSSNDYHFDLIADLSRKTHLSELALFTRLLYQNKISKSNYHKVKTDFEEKYKAKLENEKREKEKDGGVKRRGAAPQPIKSPLLVTTIQTAFYEGIINEYEVCKKLNIKANKLEQYIT